MGENDVLHQAVLDLTGQVGELRGGLDRLIGEVQRAHSDSMEAQNQRDENLAEILKAMRADTVEAKNLATHANSRITKIVNKVKWVGTGLAAGVAASGATVYQKIHKLFESLQR